MATGVGEESEGEVLSTTESGDASFPAPVMAAGGGGRGEGRRDERKKGDGESEEGTGTGGAARGDAGGSEQLDQGLFLLHLVDCQTILKLTCSVFISNKVLIKGFSRSQFTHKPVNLIL